ncbi:MAG TPA: dynamin family protein [Terriglobia bacterium]|nr:dynamin family protein [Terriglobia bacterium]
MSEIYVAKKSQPTNSSSVQRPPTGSNESPRGRILRIMERLHREAPEVLPLAAHQELESLRHKFQESRFYLVFPGQFKRGKTSLINSLIGADLLPTGVLPLTSIITIVKFGAKARARVNFTSGASKEIAPVSLAAYVTERENPRNKKGVADVEVFYPAPRLKEGLCLVDTPGIGSIFEHNTQVAYQFVPRADAGIFVFSPESPLSQTELEFLHHLRAHVEKIFFVLNKADQVNDGERSEILEFARQAIREQMPSGELRLFAVSARRVLESQRRPDDPELEASNIPQLLRSLDEFLSKHKGDVLLRSTCAALQRLIKGELLALEVEQRARAMDVTDLEAKIQTIERTWQALEQRHREAGYVLRGEIRAFEARLEKRLNEFVESEAASLVTHMKDQVQQLSKGSKGALARNVDQELRRKIAEILGDWKIEEEKAVEETFESLTSRFTREAAYVVEQIQQAAAEQFGFSWTAVSLPDRLRTESTFRIKVDDVITWGLGRFPLLLPKRLFARYLTKRLEHTCLEELYRNAGRLKADLGDRLEQSVNEYLQALDRHVEGARESVRAALRRATEVRESSEDRARDAASKQSARLQFLRAIDEELSALQKEGGNRDA